MRILRSNFESALWDAIRAQELMGAGNSAYTQGLREVLKASEAGETITVEEKDQCHELQK